MIKLALKQSAIVLITVSALSASIALAMPDGDKRMQRMQEKLDLSQEQIEMIQSIREEQRAKRKTLREETAQRIEAVLDSVQVEQFREHRAKREERRAARQEMRKQGRFHGKRHWHGTCDGKSDNT